MNQDILLFCTTVISIFFGLFIIVNPRQTFEIQRKFYEMINWRIEPISLEKEIRNTRYMGAFLIGITILIVIYNYIR